MPLINKLTVGVTLNIVDATGKKDTINIQPKGRVELATGWSLDPSNLKEYNGFIVGLQGASNPQPAPPPAP